MCLWTCSVPRNFNMRVIASEHIWHTSDVHHETALGLPHYSVRVWCASTVDTDRK